MNHNSDNKTLTVLLVSDRKSKVRKFSFSTTHVKLGLWSLALLIVLMAAVVVDYLSLLSQSVENRRLHAENTELRSQMQIVEGKLNTVETSMERIRTFVTKLKLITDVNDPDRGLNLAMGPMARMNEATDELTVPNQMRAPASVIMAEPLLKPKTMTDIMRGEVAKEEERDYAKLSIRIDHIAKVAELREQGVLELWEKLQDRSSLLSATPSTKPVQGWYTSRFGYRISPYTDKPMMHEGLDIAASPGAPVYAPADGVVTFVGHDPGYGKLIIIDHGYGVESRYGHNSQTFVQNGQKIRHGEHIASVGNTGRSTGPHLHYEVRVNGEPVDPINYILDD